MTSPLQRYRNLDKSGRLLYAAGMRTAAVVGRRAMAAGFSAIALWGALAALSVSAGRIPPVPDGCHDVRDRCRHRHRARLASWRRLGRTRKLAGARLVAGRGR